MNIISNNSRNFIALNKLLDKVHYKLLDEIKFDFEYSSVDIAHRISQLIALSISREFSRQSILSSKKGGKYFFEKLPVRLKCNDILIDTVSGSTSPFAILFIFNTIRFIALWLYVLCLFILSSFFCVKCFGKATLIYGLPNDSSDNKSINNLEKFCLNTGNDVISKSSAYVIQFAKKIISKRKFVFIYSKIPVLALLSSNIMVHDEKIFFLKKHFYLLVNYFYLALRKPIICLLWRDFALHSSVESLNNRNLIDSIILTNSNTSSQDLWMNHLPNRNFKTYFALYSQNTFNFTFNDDPVYATTTEHKFLKADLIWIWNKEYKLSLMNDGVNCSTKVIEPILWYLPERKVNLKKNKKIKISIFDVTPFDEKTLLGIGAEFSYYNTILMCKFLDDIISATRIIEASDQIEFELTLKHKRKREKRHDQKYFEHIHKLHESHSFFKLENHDVNLFNFIGESDIIISIPYSSPVILAHTLKIPAFFYDPGNQLIFPDRYFPKSIVKVAKLENLVSEIRRKLPL